MKTIQMLHEKIHKAKMESWKTSNKEVKLALYVNRPFFLTLAKELHDSHGCFSGFNISRLDTRNEDHIQGYPIYEVVTPNHPDYLIIEVK